jgi:hypothetical protein
LHRRGARARDSPPAAGSASYPNLQSADPCAPSSESPLWQAGILRAEPATPDRLRSQKALNRRPHRRPLASQCADEPDAVGLRKIGSASAVRPSSNARGPFCVMRGTVCLVRSHRVPRRARGSALCGSGRRLGFDRERLARLRGDPEIGKHVGRRSEGRAPATFWSGPQAPRPRTGWGQAAGLGGSVERSRHAPSMWSSPVAVARKEDAPGHGDGAISPPGSPEWLR